MDTGETQINYTIKELLEDIKAELRSIAASKADKSVVDGLSARLTLTETDVTVLKTQRGDTRRFNALWIPVVANIAATLALLVKATH